MTNKELSDALKAAQEQLKQVQTNYEQCFLDVGTMQKTLDDVEQVNRELHVKLNTANGRISYLITALKSSVAVI